MASTPLVRNNDVDHVENNTADYETKNVKQIINRKDNGNFNQYLATFIVNIASIAAATSMAWSSPALPKLYQPGEKFQITEEEGAWLGSLLPLGGSLGPLLAGLIVGRLGKKWTIMISLVLSLVCWLIIAFSQDVSPMYVARFITGISAGAIFCILPLYVSEILTPELRSPLGSYFTVFLGIGFTLTYAIGPNISVTAFSFVLSSIPVLGLLTIIWLPKSPYYLLQCGRKHEAIKAIAWFRGYPEEEIVQLEISEMQSSIDNALLREEKSKGFVIQLVKSRGNLKSLYYACMLVTVQQLNGLNAVLFYSESIFQMTGSSISSSMSTIIIGLSMLTSASLLPHISKLIRIKYLMCLSAVGTGISIAVLGSYFYLKEDLKKDVSHIGWLPITSLIIFVMTHMLGFGSFAWVIISEIFSPQMKSFCSSFTTALCWFWAFLITKIFSSMASTIGKANTFWVFSGICFIGLLFSIFQLPDTQGKTFQEIQDLIHSSKKKTAKTGKR